MAARTWDDDSAAPLVAQLSPFFRRTVTRRRATTATLAATLPTSPGGLTLPFSRRSAVNWSIAGVLTCLLLALAGLASAGADEPAGPGGDHLVVSRIPTASTSQAVTLVRFNGT